MWSCVLPSRTVTVNGKALGMVTVPAARSVMDALTIMYTQHCSSIAVVDTNGLFVGALYFSHIKVRVPCEAVRSPACLI